MGVPNAAGLWQVIDIENYAIFKIKWCRRSASNGRGSDCYELGGNKPGKKKLEKAQRNRHCVQLDDDEAAQLWAMDQVTAKGGAMFLTSQQMNTPTASSLSRTPTAPWPRVLLPARSRGKRSGGRRGAVASR